MTLPAVTLLVMIGLSSAIHLRETNHTHAISKLRETAEGAVEPILKGNGHSSPNTVQSNTRKGRGRKAKAGGWGRRRREVKDWMDYGCERYGSLERCKENDNEYCIWRNGACRFDVVPGCQALSNSKPNCEKHQSDQCTWFFGENAKQGLCMYNPVICEAHLSEASCLSVASHFCMWDGEECAYHPKGCTIFDDEDRCKNTPPENGCDWWAADDGAGGEGYCGPTCAEHIEGGHKDICNCFTSETTCTGDNTAKQNACTWTGNRCV